MFDKKELNNILVTIIVITFVFAFDDKSEVFYFGNWILNFIKILIFSAITVFSYDLMQKYSAKLQQLKIRHEISYNVKVLKWRKKFPITILWAIMLTLITNGKFFFAAIKKTEVITKKRVGKKFTYPKEFEISRTIAAGPITTIFLAIIVSGLNLAFLEPLKLMLILYSIYNILPIPPLDGSKIFFHSMPMFLFSFIFIILLAPLIYLFNAPIIIITSVIISLLFFYAIFTRLS